MASNMYSDKDQNIQVSVLYDYEYMDEIDNTKVWMKENEIFYLLNSDGPEWWQVCRPNEKDSPFYVPSTYVELLTDGSSNSIDLETSPVSGSAHNDSGSNTHNMENTHNHENNNILSTFKGSNMVEESNYMNYQGPPSGESVGESAIRPTTLDAEGDYVNLDELRAAANIAPLNLKSQTPPSPQSPEGDYANLQDLMNPLPPESESCEYKKTLMETWDVFLDPATNRLFYVHNQTKQKQWKPPKGKYHNEAYNKKRSRSSGEYDEILSPGLSEIKFILGPQNSLQNRKSRSVDYGRPNLSLLQMNVPPGWTVDKNKHGEDVFVNDETKHEKSDGSSSPSKSPSSDPVDKQDMFMSQGQGQLIGQRSDSKTGGLKVSRFAKTRSVMIENLNLHSPPINTGPPPPKSATLPSNLNAPIHEFPLEDGQGSRSHPDLKQPFSHQSVNMNEPIEGTLNKCKLANGKKKSKNWAMSYVKLCGSNLVFYKDQKSSLPKQGSPHGKYEQMLPLVTCSLDNNPKDYTSKKNVLLIVCPECQILLQADDDVKISEWFMKLHTKIKDLGGNPEIAQEPQLPTVTSSSNMSQLLEEPKISRKASFKDRMHKRNPSDGGTLEKKEKSKIRDALTKFMSNRSDKKELVKKGIYKDAVFGADIKQLCDKEKCKVPTFVTRSISAIEKRGLEHEGIYRIGGNISQIQKLRCEVDQGDIYDLDDPMWDVNVLTGALKLFFRELKEPLFTYPLFDKLLNSFLKDIASERLKAMKSTIFELPKCHLETVKVLFKHLTNVAQNHKENKMAAHQLAIVFGPTLIWPEVQSQNLATSMVYQSRIVEFVLLEYKNIFR